MQNAQDDFASSNHDGFTSKAAAKVRDIRVVASERARDISTRARDQGQQQLETQREMLANRLDEAAEDLTQHAIHIEGLQQDAELKVARSMEAAADYLHEHPSPELARDILDPIRRNPVRSAVIALIVGFMLARMLR
jgi:hypothetical protein